MSVKLQENRIPLVDISFPPFYWQGPAWRLHSLFWSGSLVVTMTSSQVLHIYISLALVDMCARTQMFLLLTLSFALAAASSVSSPTSQKPESLTQTPTVDKNHRPRG